MDNDNGTVPGRPRRNRRALTQYNPQYNVPVSQWVFNQHASVAEFVLDSALDGTFSMDSWGEIKGMLAYQTVDHGILTPVDTTISKYKKVTLSSHQYEQLTKSKTE